VFQAAIKKLWHGEFSVADEACSCGWGSGALYFAEQFPNAEITAFSNSKSQKEYIVSVARERGFKNLSVVTGNIVDHDFELATYDRIVSIEVSPGPNLLVPA